MYIFGKLIPSAHLVFFERDGNNWDYVYMVIPSTMVWTVAHDPVVVRLFSGRASEDIFPSLGSSPGTVLTYMVSHGSELHTYMYTYARYIYTYRH